MLNETYHSKCLWYGIKTADIGYSSGETNKKKPSQYSIEAVFSFLGLLFRILYFSGQDIFQVALRRYFLSQIVC
jgi:hypothetical protein